MSDSSRGQGPEPSDHRWTRRLMAGARAHSALAQHEIDDFPLRVVELASDGFFEWRPPAQHFRYSPSVATLLGYERNELPLNETSVAAHVYCDDFLALKRAMAEAAREGKDLEFEVRAYTKSGALRWFQLHLKVVECNAKEGITRAIGCVSDVDNITRTRQEWQRLADAEQWLSQTVQLLVRQPGDQALENCLNRLCDFLDVDHASLRRVEDGDLFHLVALGHHAGCVAPLGLYRTLKRANLFDTADAMAQGQAQLLGDITSIDVDTHPLAQRLLNVGVKSMAFLPIHYQGKFDYYLCLITTRRKQHWHTNIVQTAQLVGEAMAMVAGRCHVTEAMSRNEMRLQHALDATGDGIWEWDRAGQTYYVSPSLLYMAGYDEELLPLSAEKIAHLLVRPTTLETFFADYPNQRHRPPGHFEFVIHLRHRAGREIPVLVRGKQTAWDASGRATACVGAVTALQTLQHLTALPSTGPLFDTAGKADAGSRFAEAPGDTETFHVRDFFDELSAELTRLAGKKGLRLSNQLSVNLPVYLSGPAAKLRACIRAVVESAAAVTRHGEIKLAASVFKQTGGKVDLHIVVEDSGRELDETTVSTLVNGTDGTVAGALEELHRCWQWVRAQRGETDITPRPGGGNHYAFTLAFAVASRPAATLTDRTMPNTPTPSNGSGEQKAGSVDESTIAALNDVSVLLAEDNPINQQVASGMLRRKGVRVTIANNGREAVDILEAAAANSFDLVLMDLEMPVMDGFEATRTLRRSERFAALPVVALTAYAGDSDKAKCFQAGMNDHLAKPVKPDLLYRTLSKYVKKKSA